MNELGRGMGREGPGMLLKIANASHRTMPIKPSIILQSRNMS